MKRPNLDEFGGSCIIELPKRKIAKRRDTDYDGYNDYQSFVIESDWEN